MRRFRSLVRVIFVLLLFLSVSNQIYASAIEALVPDELDCRTQYTHFSKNRLRVNGYSFYDAIIIGELEIREVMKDIILTELTATYHLDKIDFDIKLPLMYRRENILSSTNKQSNDISETTVDNLGLGDIELAFSRNINRNNGLFSVSTVSVSAPTGLDPYSINEDQVPLGSGHYGIRLGVTGGKKLDPLMIFASGNYTINFPREVNTKSAGEIKVDPGNMFNYSIGLVYAINQQLALNTRFSQSFTSLTRQDDKFLIGSDVVSATMYIGASYVNEKNVNYDVNLGIGLSEESPDFSLSLSFPINIK